MSAHDAVTSVLVYLAIGSLVWMVLLCAGVLQVVQVWRLRSRPALVLASVYAVVAWPVFGVGLCLAMARRSAR